VNKMSVIELKNITKSFMDGMQKREILHDLNLTVNKGEFVAIVGPSGSGKSTFLSIAGLLLSSDSGEIHIANQNLTNVTQSEWTKKRLELLGFIFQDHQLLSYMTVGDQLEEVSKLKGQKDAAKRKEEVQTLLKELGVEGCYYLYPNQISGGQKQRVAIARAFIGNPQLILADEPTASLDPEKAQEIAQLIQREVKEKQKSAIMVTHDRSVLEYVDTVYELKKGSLVRL
jgi:ABC transporter, ATP-binding protein